MKERGPGGPGGGFGPPGGGFGGPGGGGGGGGRGVELDPLVGLDNNRMPLRSKLLAVPALKAKYLANVKKIAQESLEWKKFGPVVSGYRKLIEKEVEIDTRKLDSFEAFKRNTDDTIPTGGGGGRGQGMNLRAFSEQRQEVAAEPRGDQKARSVTVVVRKCGPRGERFAPVYRWYRQNWARILKVLAAVTLRVLISRLSKKYRVSRDSPRTVTVRLMRSSSRLRACR